MMLNSGKYNIAFVVYFQFCSILRFFNRKQIFVLDIRTASVSVNKFKRRLQDGLCTFESMFFRHLTVISQGVANKLGVNRENVHILPLGGESISPREKRWHI